ncbi:hypothetical protein BGW36DRAFT_390686, partial [Talaromyces proteolyticus]
MPVLSLIPYVDSSRLFGSFPLTNLAAKNELTIWLNSGPGCSSLDSLRRTTGRPTCGICEHLSTPISLLHRSCTKVANREQCIQPV